MNANGREFEVTSSCFTRKEDRPTNLANRTNGLADVGAGFAESFRPFRFFRGQFETTRKAKKQPRMNTNEHESFRFIRVDERPFAVLLLC